MTGMRLAEVAGRVRLVDAKGQLVPPERRISTTAWAVTASVEAAYAAGTATGREATAAAVQAVAKAGAQAGFDAGIKYATELVDSKITARQRSPGRPAKPN